MRHASSATPGGERDIEELATLCEQVDREAGTATEDFPKPEGLGSDPILYVKNACGFSRAAQLAVDNLHATLVSVKNVSQDPAALEALRSLSGEETAPCLNLGGQAISESAEIVEALAARLAPIR